jgi:hypothetical protein
VFDPYHKWLGIPPGQRPPTYYQLLGISPTERDAEVIEEAAIRQTAHVRTYQIGPHSADCTRILNEIAQASETLLNPARRREYDGQDAEQEVVTAAPVRAQSAVAVRQPVVRRRPELAIPDGPAGPRRPILLAIVLAVCALVIVLAVIGDMILLKVYFRKSPPDTQPAKASSQGAVEPARVERPAPDQVPNQVVSSPPRQDPLVVADRKEDEPIRLSEPPRPPAADKPAPPPEPDPAAEAARLAREEAARKEREAADKARKEAGEKERARKAAAVTETRAAKKLALIKQLLDEGQTDIFTIRFRLKEILRDYPKTKAADEAKKLLKKLDD